MSNTQHKTISWNDERVERRDYDSAARLSHRVREHWIRGGYSDVYDSVLTYQHDAAGRLTSVTESFAGDDITIARLRLEYRDDGSVFEERIIDTDVSDQSYSGRLWSAGCSELLPLLLREVSGPCAAELPAVGDFRIP